MKKEKRNVLYYHSTRPDISGLTRRQILLGGRVATTEVVYGSKENFTVVYTVEALRCIGPKIFWQNNAKDMLTFKGGRFFGSLNNNTINIIIRVFNLDWIDPFSRWLLRTDKRLWAMVIQGKITNPESLAKRFSRMYFKGVFSYKALKIFHKSRLGEITLNDVYYYTSNPNLFIEKFENFVEDDYYLIADIIKYCRIENTQLNPLWSRKRMEEEHQMQIDRDIVQELAEYSDEPIAPPFKRDGLELILNERDAAKESILMHNCIHRCYWPKIKRGEYAVIKGCIGGTPFDMGVYISRKSEDIMGITLDQIHSRYNRDVSWEIKDRCHQWLKYWGAEVVNICRDIRTANKDNNTMALPFDDTPF